MLEERRRQRSDDRRRSEDDRGQSAGPRHQRLRSATDEERRQQEQQSTCGHADAPEGKIALGLPVGRGARDADQPLGLVHRNREERHARRLVGIRVAAVLRSVEEPRLDRQRVIQDDVTGELVAGPILWAREVDDGERRERDERNHEKLEAIAAERWDGRLWQMVFRQGRTQSSAAIRLTACPCSTQCRTASRTA